MSHEGQIEETFKELKIKRGFCKGNLTRCKTHLSKLNLQTIDKKCFLELQRRLNNLNPLINDFNSVQSQIELLSESPEVEVIERDNFEKDYYDLCSTIEEALETFTSHQNCQSNNLNQSNASINSTSLPHPSNLQLPVINVEVFSGDYNKWIEFRDCFQAVVGKNIALSNVQKLCYLRKSLSPDVLKTIESLSLTDANYEVAWRSLTNRYEKGKRIVESHVRKIISFSPIHKESSKDLRNLYDTVNNNLQALQTLGQPVESWDAILIPIITDKLDSGAKREWELFYIQEIEKDPENNVSPTVNSLLKIIKKRSDLLETLEIQKNDLIKSNTQIIRNDHKSKSILSSHLSTNVICCYFCKGEHTIYKCEEFLKLNVFDRIKEIKGRNLCLICLRPHGNSICTAANCRKCNKPHNSLLHINKQKSADTAATVIETNDVSLNDNFNEMQNNATTVVTATSKEKTISAFVGSQVLLSTAIIYVYDPFGNTHKIRALLDSGSMTNFITKRFLNKLKINAIPIDHSIIGVGQVSSNIRHKSILTISSRDSTFESKITCLVLEEITGSIPQFCFDSSDLQIPDNLELADPTFNVSRPVDMLLGSGIFWRLINSEQIVLKNKRLVLQATKLGWIIAGDTSTKLSNKSINCCNINLDMQIKKFWETEELVSKPIRSESERFCEDHFVKSHTRNQKGRFIVRIPFKKNCNELGHSKELALKRFLMLEKRLLNENSLRNEYVHFMKEYEAMNHMTEISKIQDDEELHYYIPHHAVVRESSCTTKVRVVFDASMKTTSGLSLNEVQHVGPTIQNDLFSIILHFRLFQFVITADISKMYRIRLNNDEKRFHRIFWREDPSIDLKSYELNTVTYGTASAPFLSIRCLYQLALDHETTHPVASNAIKNNFYVDDFLYGSDSESEIIEVQRDVTNILEGAGMNLRKWLCNKSELINQFKLNDNLEITILKMGENEASKTLGISWNPADDTILYSSSISPIFTERLTKRFILSRISQIFDPLGLLAPITIVAKILIQHLWLTKVDWDDEIPKSLQLQWHRFQEELTYLKTITIPRQITASDRINMELHGFGDASERAYGACVYVRTKLADGSYISRLLCAKSRVAPLKRLSLPRLELSSALLLAQLIDKIKSSFELKVNKIHLWSDSTITLSWIRADSSRWKTFVANRVAEIQQLTNIHDWKHVRSNENPADLVSRGVNTQELINCQLWWTGPTWLTQPDLPKFELYVSNDDIPEKRISTNVVVETNFYLFNKFSNLKTLQRVTAYCIRFASNAKLKTTALRNFASLSTSEMQTSLNVLIKLAQKEAFPEEHSNLLNKKLVSKGSKLLPLNPFMDDHDLIRVGGRLKNSIYPFSKKYPVILPNKHVLTKIILNNEHIRLLHCGPSALLSSIREVYWPIKGKNLAKHVVHSCVKCFRAKPRASEYLMGNLPKSRVTPSPPFTNVGIDYAGPFLLKDRVTRNAKLLNGYICLFICLATKAIHLEAVSDLTTQCFLAALKRFMGRRGKPTNIYSDNAKTFVGASKELKKFHNLINHNNEVIQNELSKDNISWHFIPARSPTFGGIWEAGIKSVKFHLKRVLGNAKLAYEDFLTILIQIEAVVNSRPLCPLTTDPDVIPLTPGHFLIGRSLTSLPEPDYTDTPDNRLKRYHRLQKINQHFWKRWSKEYMSELQTRVKWNYPQTNSHIMVGKVVLVKEDDVPSMQWPLGVIVKLHPGNDNITRVVSVKVRGNVLTRSVTKICILPDEL